MSEGSEVKTRTGYLRVVILMDEAAMGKLAFFSGPRVTIITRKTVLRVPMDIGQPSIIPVPAGSVTLYAQLGAAKSKKKRLFVRAGKISKVAFRFGK